MRVYTAEVRAARSIFPGDAFADLMLLMTIIPILDVVTKSIPRIILGVVADDVQLTLVGENEAVKSDLSTAVAYVIGEFENK